MDKKQKHPWGLIWLFNTYVKCRIWVSFYKQTFCYYFGIYSPLWLISFLTHMYQMNKWQLNDTHLKIYHVEYAVCKKHLVSEKTSDSSLNNDSLDNNLSDDKSFQYSDDDISDNNDIQDSNVDKNQFDNQDPDNDTDDSSDTSDSNDSQESSNNVNTLEVHHHYCYDITDRSLWYFYMLGNDYDGYFEYIKNTLPFGPKINNMNIDDNHIIVKYGTKKQTETQPEKHIKNTHTNKNVYVALINNKGLYELQTNNRPFIQGSITFNTLFFLSDDL